MSLTKATYSMINGAPVNVLDFGAVGEGVTDDTTAIQAACNYASSNGRKTVFLPAGSYKISSTIYTTDLDAAPGAVACGFVGEGPFSTRLIPDGDITVVNILGSYVPYGGFSVEWPLTAIGSIPSTRIGVEFCDGYNQVSQTKIQDILVTYAYNSFKLRDWTGSPGALGAVYVLDLERLVSFRAAEYGFKLVSVDGGSTTLRLSTCWANSSNSVGTGGGKGFYISGVQDVVLENCAVDKCIDNAFNFVSCLNVDMLGTALESCFSNTHTEAMIKFTAVGVANVYGVKDIDHTINIVGAFQFCYGVFAGSGMNCNVTNYLLYGPNLTAGSFYKAGLNAATTRLNVDASVSFAEAQDNGWFTQISYGGTRYSSLGTIPTQGTNLRGEYVRNMLPAIGSAKGWFCTVAGTPGTWVSEGNL